MRGAEYLRRGQGRSDGAEEAEAAGFLPATRAGKALGVPGRFISDCCAAAEWHHVGKYAQARDYYDVAEVRAALGTPLGVSLLAAWRDWQRAKKAMKRVIPGSEGWSAGVTQEWAAYEHIIDLLDTTEGPWQAPER